MIESMSDQIFSELGQSHSNFRHQNFIIIGSALGRSGTTAIFRLFQSSQLFNNFAEDHNVFEIARALFSSIANAQNYKKINYLEKQKIPSQSWSTIIIPESQNVINSSVEAFYTFMKPYEILKGQVKYTTIKKPSRAPSEYFTFQYFFPKTKIIFVHRDFREIIKSSITYNKNTEYTSEKIKEEFQKWVLRSESYLDLLHKNPMGLPIESFCHINYGDIQNNKKIFRIISHLFGGKTEGIDLAVLDKRINNFGSYAPPSELNSEQEKFIASHSRKIDSINQLFEKLCNSI